MMRWRRQTPTVLALAMASLVPTAVAFAEPFVLPHRNLNCSADFPCSPELQRRIEFWVSVFVDHGDDKIILHDSPNPERVFSVLTTQSKCSRRHPAKDITAERERVKRLLLGIASSAGGEGEKTWDAEQRHLASLFAGLGASEIRGAADRIRCQEGNRTRFVEGLKRYGAYRDIVVDRLRRASLPTDLQFLPFVESAYDPKAQSRVGAVGLWQIMPQTGRTLGLTVNSTLDERRDPVAATEAAARYLGDSRDSLMALAKTMRPDVAAGDVFPFVVTSYNYGAAGMRRAMNKHGPDFVGVLQHYRGRSFRVAVKNFYASFLAARYAAQNAAQLFGAVDLDPAFEYDTLRLGRGASVARLTEHLGLSVEQLDELNPAFGRNIMRGFRAVPKGFELKLPLRPEGWEAQAIALRSLPVETRVASGTHHKVQPGDTACRVARDYGVSCRDLIDENALGSRAMIRVGQVLTIPGGTAPASAPVGDGVLGVAYRVRGGDSPCRIARRHSLSCDQLLQHNGLARSSTIHPGQVLSIPATVAADSASSHYSVRKGDTPCAIARRHGVPCSALLTANDLGRGTTIYVGQTLKIPSGD
jgi:membrane-bound lytic murein transglycosylase D